MSEAVKPPEQRPEHPDFWCKRFGEGVTPWDAGKVPDAFADFISRQLVPLTTLIPGCGSAWEAGHLADLGPTNRLDLRTRLPLRPATQTMGRLEPAHRRTAAKRRHIGRVFLRLRTAQRSALRHPS